MRPGLEGREGPCERRRQPEHGVASMRPGLEGREGLEATGTSEVARGVLQ